VEGLAVNGNLLAPAALADPLVVSVLLLIMGTAVRARLVFRHRARLCTDYC